MREQCILLLIMVLQARVCSAVDMRPVFEHLSQSLSDASGVVVVAAEKVPCRLFVIGFTKRTR